ncbi:MAG: hypothetical protein KatS3mg110_1051 [Pirellulaceae bacterium]|nr:MAG: hypothetical protein KatS3mg110_1051 [Pirellulaceae bacterium]
MPIVYIDDKEVHLQQHERLNGIQAAARAGVQIPYYCWHPGLSVVASCRMCLVECGKRDPQTGQISMLPKLVPACQTPATDGTVFLTNSDRVREARAMVEEDLLLRHPIDCPICDKAGECRLQDYHFLHGRGQRRADIKPFTSRKRSLGPTITLFVDRCIMCSRCVRFCREIAGTSELMVVNRGAHEEIDVFPGFPLSNKLAGNVVDLCPVGALADKDFLYRQRVWYLKSHPHVCAGCSTGCSIYVDQNQDRIWRLRPRENPHVNQWWMCDEGRYGWKYVHDPNRITAPCRRQEGQLKCIDWDTVWADLETQLPSVGGWTAVLSPFQTVEEAYLLAELVRSVDPDATIAVGPIPSQGRDERFPNGFTIRAEKCPNRIGVQTLAGQLQGELLSWEELKSRWKSQPPEGGLWIAGGYPASPWQSDDVEVARRARLLVVQELFPSALGAVADYRLPAAAFVEREGSYVNVHHRLQVFQWAIRPPRGVYHDGHIYWKLLGRPGLYRSAPVLQEVAERFLAFAAAKGEIPDVGVDLRIVQLAEPAETVMTSINSA